MPHSEAREESSCLESGAGRLVQCVDYTHCTGTQDLKSDRKGRGSDGFLLGIGPVPESGSVRGNEIPLFVFPSNAPYTGQGNLLELIYILPGFKAIHNNLMFSYCLRLCIVHLFLFPRLSVQWNITYLLLAKQILLSFVKHVI